MADKPKVDFVIAGAMRCGTTALWRMLRRHPQIYMPRSKSTHYFSYSPFAFTPLSRLVYEQRFRDAPGEACVGEASVSYLFHPSALRRLRRYNPEMKLIILLRDPVGRAYSHWNHNVRKKREERGFLEAMRAEVARPPRFKRRLRFAYVERSLYALQCTRLFEIFPREQTHFIKSEDLTADPGPALQEIAMHLGVKPARPPREWMWHKASYASRLSNDDRNELIEVFRDDVGKLEAMLGWDCSDWLRPQT